MSHHRRHNVTPPKDVNIVKIYILNLKSHKFYNIKNRQHNKVKYIKACKIINENISGKDTLKVGRLRAAI